MVREPTTKEATNIEVIIINIVKIKITITTYRTGFLDTKIQLKPGRGMHHSQSLYCPFFSLSTDTAPEGVAWSFCDILFALCLFALGSGSDSDGTSQVLKLLRAVPYKALLSAASCFTVFSRDSWEASTSREV